MKIESIDKVTRIMNIIDDNGDWIKLYYEDRIVDALKNFFGITKGTYFWDDDVGSNIVSYLWQYLDGITIQNLIDDLSEGIYKYVPNTKILNMDIIKTSQENTLVIEIIFGYAGKKILKRYHVTPEWISILD